jgi:2-polyprenyl-3-methyl-5-hydroxy-6-metoxy-1,4-benzoquinol methylase
MNDLDLALASMDKRYKKVLDNIQIKKPDLINALRIYAAEAKYGRIYLDKKLKSMSKESSILEIGGGTLALAIQLKFEGFNISCVQPKDTAFPEINYLAESYLKVASREKINLKIFEFFIENINLNQKYDLIFSINVMEHVKNPYLILKIIKNLLSYTGTYKFYCPNYDFPYEPHFAKFLIKYRNNAFFFPSSKLPNLDNLVTNPTELYKTLNFITLRKVLLSCEQLSLIAKPNKKSFFELIDRSFYDKELLARHTKIRLPLKLIKFSRVHYFFKFFPSKFSPIIDCEISKLVNLH